MDEKSGRVVPKTKTSKKAFSPVGEEEYRNLISKLTFYDFDALDVVDGVNLVVSFKQSDIPRFCDVVEGYCTLSAYSKYENKLSAFIACIIDSIPDDQCYIVRYDDCWTANDSVMPDLHIALEHNNISNINKAIVGKKCSKLVSIFVKSCLRYNSFIQIVFPRSQVIISPSDHLDVFIAYHSDAMGISLKQLLQKETYNMLQASPSIF